jgi:hypothetical protein
MSCQRLLFGWVVAMLAFPAVASGTVVYAGGGWAAIDFGTACEARARSVLLAPRGKVGASAGFTFTRDRRRWGEFSARLSRMPRPGSSVLLTVGGRPFLLVARRNNAWSRGSAQDQALMAAARAGGNLRVEGRDVSGRRFRDTYSLAGAATAIDAAAARCAGKHGRQ